QTLADDRVVVAAHVLGQLSEHLRAACAHRRGRAGLATRRPRAHVAGPPLEVVALAARRNADGATAGAAAEADALVGQRGQGAAPALVETADQCVVIHAGVAEE